MSVDTPNIQYENMTSAGAWDLCESILGGTPTMRSAGTMYLPKEPDEKQKNYNVRVKRSFLFNAYKKTIDKYVARPFSRPAVWDIENNDEAKTALTPVMQDMDGEGLHHQDFARDYFNMMMKFGVASAYVGYPEIDDPASTSKGDEQADGLRPINRVLKTPAVIGWQTQEQKNGTEKLIQIRVKERYISDEADWTQTEYDQIRVITVDGTEAKWEIYRRKTKKKRGEDEEYVLEDSGDIIINKKVPTDMPLVTAYTDKEGMMTSLPPFLEMAWTNLELWQSTSDQKNILRFDRMGILFVSGVTDDEKKAGLIIAPTSAFMSESPDSDMKRVETSGAPADNGWKDIRDIMERLEVLGMDPMIQRLANVKATGLSINEENSRSQIESWIDSANIAMRKIIRFDLAWMGFDVPLEDITYQINQDFVFATKTSQEVKDVIEIRKMGDLGHVDFLKEMQRYGRLADGDPTEMAERARVERAPLTPLPGRDVRGTPPKDLGAEKIGDASREEVIIGVTP